MDTFKTSLHFINAIQCAQEEEEEEVKSLMMLVTAVTWMVVIHVKSIDRSAI